MTHRTNQKKIILMLLPFWDPQIPPLGIACLKSFIQQKGFRAAAVDLNTNEEFKAILENYFETLKQYIPGNKWGNYYKIVHDVLRNHMMAHINYKDEKKYLELVDDLIYQIFFTRLAQPRILELCQLLSRFYTRLERVCISDIEAQDPSVIGISVYSGTLAASCFVFKLVKKKYPHIKTVMGGGVFADQLHVDSPDFKFFLEAAPYIDAIMVGEGEQLFLNYLLNEFPESKKVYTLKDIDYAPLELSAVEVPDFSDFDLNLYPYLSAYTSRSCPYQCSFCAETVNWGRFRKKTPQQVVRELTKLKETYHSQLYLLGDSLLNPGINGFANQFLKNDTSIYWDGYLRADKSVCDVNNTLLWRRAGFYRARLGLESGSRDVLDLMGKQTTPEQMKTAVTGLAYAGIKTTSYWVVGHPGETETDFQQTLKLLEELKDDLYEADCTPFQYFLSGQSNSNTWKGIYKYVPLYDPNARDMLMVQTWILGAQPARQEIYERVSRFVQHCQNLGISNPYSLKDTYKADNRWKKLQPNAVPALLEFSKHANLSENKVDKKIHFAENAPPHEISFGF